MTRAQSKRANRQEPSFDLNTAVQHTPRLPTRGAGRQQSSSNIGETRLRKPGREGTKHPRNSTHPRGHLQSPDTALHSTDTSTETSTGRVHNTRIAWASGHLEEHSLGEREPERLSRMSVELDVDSVVRESGGAVPSQNEGGGGGRKTDRDRATRAPRDEQRRAKLVSTHVAGEKGQKRRSLTIVHYTHT